MSVTYATTVKTDRMTATRDAVCGGTSGTLEIGTSGMGTVLATFTLTTTGGTVSGAIWTLAFLSNTVVASATGTAAAAQIKDSSGTVLISGLTVGLTATDIELSGVLVTSGQNVILGSSTITHAT